MAIPPIFLPVVNVDFGSEWLLVQTFLMRMPRQKLPRHLWSPTARHAAGSCFSRRGKLADGIRYHVLQHHKAFLQVFISATWSALGGRQQLNSSLLVDEDQKVHPEFCRGIRFNKGRCFQLRNQSCFIAWGMSCSCGEVPSSAPARHPSENGGADQLRTFQSTAEGA